MSKLIIEIVKISDIQSIEKADKIELAIVKGWNCIVSKGQYKIGDLVIYCPPDSIIPPNLIEKYKLEFLKKNSRVDTIKLRGVISQGLILDVPDNFLDPKEGQEVAYLLGITKYEPPEPNYSCSGQQQKKRKSNPLFDKYTDIDNINNFNTIFEEGEEVIITEKIHGSNARYANLPVNTNVFWGWILKLFGKDYEFVYGSHEIQKKWSNIHKGFYKDDVWGKIARKYKFSEWLPKDYIIYGEIYGKRIQELTYEMDDIDIRIFDIKYKGRYLDWIEFLGFMSMASDKCNLQYVPVLFRGKYLKGLEKIYAQGNSTLPGAGNQIREGCVIKPMREREQRPLGRVILKSLNPEYLLTKNRTEFH
jgi:RNA ligase (TIGR02306 family)